MTAKKRNKKVLADRSTRGDIRVEASSRSEFNVKPYVASLGGQSPEYHSDDANDFAEHIIEIMQVIVLVLDTEGKIVRFNPFMEQLCGYSLPEVQGKDWFETFLPERDRDRIRSLFFGAIGGIQIRGIVSPIVTKDGREHLIEWHKTKLGDSENNTIGLLAIGVDITERQRNEEELRASEDKYRELYDEAPLAYLEVDIEGNIRNANQRVGPMFGYTLEEILKRSVFGLLANSSLGGAKLRRLLQRFPLDGPVEDEELEACQAGSEPIWVSLTMRPVWDDRRRITGMRMILADITERKRAEAEIARLASFPRLNPNPIVEIDFNGHVQYVNPVALKLFPDIETGGLDHPWLVDLAAELPAIKSGDKGASSREIRLADHWYLQTIHCDSALQFIRIYAMDITERKHIEETLRESEQKFRAVVEQSADGIALIDAEGRIIEWNRAEERITGMRRADAIGHPIWEVMAATLPPERRTASRIKTLRERVLGLLKTGNPNWSKQSLEEELQLPSGEHRFVQHTIFPVKTDMGLIAGSVNLDITERRQLENQLRYQANLLEHVTDAIVATDLNFNITSWNRGAEKLYGWTAAEAIGKSIADLFVSEKPQATENVRQELVKHGAWQGESVHRRKDGGPVIVLSSVAWLEDHTGSRVGIVGVNHDITERKKGEDRLRQLSSAVEQSASMIMITDPAGKIEYVNSQFSQVTGYSFDEAVGQTPKILASGQTPREVYAEMWGAMTAGREWRGEMLNKTKHGDALWVYESISCIRNEEGAVTHFLAVQEDITREKRVRDELARREKQLSEAQRIANVGSWERDIQADMLWWSAEVYRIFGLKPDQFEATSEAFFSHVHPDDRERVLKANNEALYQRKPFNIEYRIVRPNGSIRQVHAQAEISLDQNGQPAQMIGTVHDITERKGAEEAEQRERLKAQTLRRTAEALVGSVQLGSTLNLVIEQLSQIVPYTWARIMLVDENKVRVVGSHGREEQYGAMGDTYSYLEIELYKTILETAQQLIIHDVQSNPDWAHVATWEKDDTRTWIGLPLIASDITMGLLSIGSDRPDAFSQDDLEVISALADQAALAIRNAHIIEQLETSLAELRETQTHLLRQERLSVAGEIAAGVAHQINNPLTAIIGYTQLLLMDIPVDNPSYKSVEAIKAAAYRAGAVVQRMLDLTRQKPYLLQPVDINISVEGALSLIRPQLEYSEVKLMIQLAPGLPLISASNEHLEDVWLNLLLNARDAVRDIPGRSIIEITTRLSTQGDAVEFVIHNNGLCISPEDMERIFTPFFTTKDYGTGLGLPICWEVVRNHNGTIEVKSEEGQGVTFVVSLPVK